MIFRLNVADRIHFLTDLLKYNLESENDCFLSEVQFVVFAQFADL